MEAPSGEPIVGGLTRSDMEAAALAGRQVAAAFDPPAALELLRDGELIVVGRLLAASNATFFCMVASVGGDPAAATVASCVYKPIKGERPLYDFPDGTLACREVAAHAVSEAIGWGIVPPTVIRDGPFGEGMVQWWMEVDESADITQLITAHSPALRRIAILDVVLNNADRKGGHLLPLADGRVFGIDNGLCFAAEPKLRTLLWNWRGKPLTTEELTALGGLRERLAGDLGRELERLLSPAEVDATVRRVDELLRGGRLPRPDPNRPAIPWPPY